MTLINDSIDKVKTALLVAIKDNLTDAYPSEFGDYGTSKGDVYTKVFWADTIRHQPRFPYCMLSINGDVSEGLDEITHVKIGNVLSKKTISRSIMSVSIDLFDMGNEQMSKSSLKAENFCHKVARQLRKYFNGDEMLDWFSGNEYYPRQIGIRVQDEIDSSVDWSDTDTVFRYSFIIQVGWDDTTITRSDLATGAKISLGDDNFVVKINGDE